MNWQYTPYIVPLIISAAVSIALAGVAWYHRSAPGARPLIVLMLAVAEWLLTYAVSLTYLQQADQLFWTNATYIGIVSIPTAWLAFVLAYTGHNQWLSRRNLVLLTIVPILTLLVIWTNDMHWLFRSEVGQATFGPFVTLQVVMGPAFWFHTAYSYLLLAGGTFLLFYEIFRTPYLYRGQSISMLIGASIPWAGNVFYLANLNPLPGLDITPFTFTLTSIVISWALFRFRLLDIVPVARAAVIENIGDGVIVLDANNRIVDINPAACQAVHTDRRTIMGQPAERVLAQYSSIVAHLQDATSTRVNVVLHAGPEQRIFELRLSPIYDRAARPTGQLIVLHDVTEITEATRALQQAKEAAEASDYAKTAFIRNMSHELRTPLTAIIGYNELIQYELRELGLNDIVADAERIQTASAQLLTLINNVLDLSRIEAGKVNLDPETFAIATLLDEVVITVQPLIAQNDNDLAVMCEDDPGNMHTDRLKVHEVLLNLLSNAAKFTSHGHIILATQRNTVEGVVWIRFRVSDTGIGMSTEQLGRIFQVFTQGDNTIARKYGGTGLGLALSRRLCQIMGGTIDVESQTGIGTTFTVDLPAELPIAATQPIDA